MIRNILLLYAAFLAPVSAASLWSGSVVPATPAVTNDSKSVNLGVQFYADVPGTVTGVRFYKGVSNTGTHVGTLWTKAGSKLASVTFAGETASGWQQANFATPVTIAPNTVYVVSYLAPKGSYAQDQQYGWSSLSAAPLHVSGTSPGIFAYSSTTAFPNQSWGGSNYYVDLVFSPTVVTYSISGTVSGVAGSVVTLSGAASKSATPDAQGNYSFSGLSNGSYVVAPSKTGYTFSPANTAVAVNGANVSAINFTGTPNTTQPISVLDYGAKGDGVTDDTAAIQKALSAAVGKTLNFPKPSASYLVGPLSIPANSNITLDSGTIVKARSGFTSSQVLLSIQSVSNVSIVGYGATFTMPKAEYTGEHNHCMAVHASTNVHLEGFACNNSGGDGFYIADASQGVTLLSVSADNNRRQGLSLISGVDVSVTNSSFTNTNGTDPQCGIDIEPNVASDLLRNITFSGVQTSGNTGCGISYSLFALDNTSAPVSITVNNFHDSNSKGVGIQGQCNWTTGTGGVTGTIQVNDSVVDNPAGFTGVYLKDWEQSCAPITFTRLVLNNPNSTGITMLARSTVREQIGNMHFAQPTISGTPTKLSDYVIINDTSGKGYSNITFTNPATFTGAAHPFAYPQLLQ